MNNAIPYYYRHLNTRFLKILPQGLGRVLEFGCSAGLLCENYKKENPNTVWHGVEIMSDAAEYAKDRLDEVWVMDANKLIHKQEMLTQKYDAIIYGDVIEHLIDPVKSLPHHLELLADDGELIACIPNIQHWTIVKDLLKGKWEYADSGLLDNTHLRFFTRESIASLVDSLDMTLVLQQRYSYEDSAMFNKRIEERDEILELLKLVNISLGQEHNDLDFRTFQYGIRARKKA